MDFYDPNKGKKGSCDGSGNEFVQPGEKDTYVQLVISLALGSTAFLAFCVSPVEKDPSPHRRSIGDDAEMCPNRSYVHGGSRCTPPDAASLAPR